MFNPPHPGSILKELYLEPLNLTVTEASLSLGVTRKTLSFLINEKCSISFSNNMIYGMQKEVLMFPTLKYYFVSLLKWLRRFWNV